jgi:hypothetical protein
VLLLLLVLLVALLAHSPGFMSLWK